MNPRAKLDESILRADRRLSWACVGIALVGYAFAFSDPVGVGQRLLGWLLS